LYSNIQIWSGYHTCASSVAQMPASNYTTPGSGSTGSVPTFNMLSMDVDLQRSGSMSIYSGKNFYMNPLMRSWYLTN
jgi:hypothetical protein